MSYDDLDQEFHDMATDAPDSGSVRTAVRVGFARRQKRVRTVALVATATAVVVIAGGISLGGKIGLSSGPAAPGSDWQQHVRPVIIPQGSTLTPLTDDAEVISPVTPTVHAPGPDDTMFWQKDVNTLAVTWLPPRVTPSALASGPESAADETTFATVLSPGYGYVISPGADIPVQTSDSTVQSAAKPISRPTTIAGHPAVISDVPNSTWSSLTPIERWVTWRLTDGRYIHVWANAHPDNDADLLAFAAGIVQRPTEFARHMTVGVTAPGFTVEGIAELGSPGYLDAAVVDLCPSGTTTVFFTDITPPCVSVEVLPDKDMGADQKGEIKRVTVDGVVAKINKTTFETTADLGRGFGALILDARTTTAPDLDIATFVAAVRLDPSIKPGSSPSLNSVSVDSGSGSASASAVASSPEQPTTASKGPRRSTVPQSEGPASSAAAVPSAG